ncbi:MAG: Internalin-J precursor, partial [Bacteroidota bacterium]
MKERRFLLKLYNYKNESFGKFRLIDGKGVLFFVTFFLFTLYSSPIFGQACTLVNLPNNLKNGLVAYYPFCGNSNDISGNNNALQAFGLTATTDRFGTTASAYSFSNTQTNVTSYLKATNPTPFAKNTYTISAWFNSNQFYPNIGGVTYNYQSIVGYAPQYYTWGPAYNLQLLHADNSTLATTQWTSAHPSQDVRTPTGTITTNQWYHAVVSYDGTTLKMFKDGVLVGSTAATIDYANQVQFLIGANGDGPSPGGLYGGFNGKLDDIGFWDRALDVCEVTQLYNLTATNPQP